MALYLVAGTPGQSKGAAAKKIRAWLRAEDISVSKLVKEEEGDDGNEEGELPSVEDELLELFPEYKERRTSLQEPRVAMIGERAQDEIKDRWPDAFRSAVEKATSGNPDVAIVLLCFEYYRYETYEFYSPVDCRAIQEAKPKSILTLIDDVFDIYYRLSQPGEVFDIQTLVERSYPATKGEMRDSRDLRRLYKDALSIAVGSLLRILTWREKEIECGANVSRTIGCEHSVLATKHPLEAGSRLLLGSTTREFKPLGISYPVYVSHPISRPRRDRATQGGWPTFVDDLDVVVAQLSTEPVGGCHLVPVMPTAIDEYRILDDGTYLHPCLTPRWRLQDGELLFSLPRPPGDVKPFENYEDYEARGLPLVFDPPIDFSGRRVGLPLSDPEVSGMMRNLRESIRLQMAGRDHLLVRQCPGFFLYRPLYGEYEFSGGVASEIHTFDQIRKYSGSTLGCPKRHVAFVHDEDDAREFFAKSEDAHFPDPVHQASAALNTAASELVEKSAVKTKRPSSPDDETVARALQASGDPEPATLALHREMFPSPRPGTVGSEQPLGWEETKERLCETVSLERVKALSSDIGHGVSYTYSQDQPVWRFAAEEGESDTYVDVVAGLEKDPSRRNAVATRVREFFGSAVK